MRLYSNLTVTLYKLFTYLLTYLLTFLLTYMGGNDERLVLSRCSELCGVIHFTTKIIFFDTTWKLYLN